MAKRSTVNGSPALFDDIPTATEAPAPKKRKASTTDGAAAARLIDLFHTQFIARHGCKPVIHGAKDTVLLKKLVATWGEPTVRDLIVEYLDPHTRDPRVLRSDFTIGAFSMLAQYLKLRHGQPVSDDRTIGNIEAAHRAMQPRV